LSLVEELTPDLIISAGFRHIVPKDILEVPQLGAVNLHKSHLPFNRGANPNVWSIVEDDPAGVSIHYMTSDVDAGPLIDRRKVSVEPDDTGRTLYERLEQAQIDQFKTVWPDIRDGDPETTTQSQDEGTYHYKQDFVDLWELDLDETVKIGNFLDRLRALTFPPYNNAYFETNGEKYHVEVRISHEDAKKKSVSEKNVPTYSE
jgi:methionyl-tRNA formyltransferase